MPSALETAQYLLETAKQEWDVAESTLIDPNDGIHDYENRADLAAASGKVRGLEELVDMLSQDIDPALKEVTGYVFRRIIDRFPFGIFGTLRTNPRLHIGTDESFREAEAVDGKKHLEIGRFERAEIIEKITGTRRQILEEFLRKYVQSSINIGT